MFAIFIEELRADAQCTLFKLEGSIDVEAAKKYCAVMQQLFLDEGATIPGPIHQVHLGQQWFNDEGQQTSHLYDTRFH